MSGIRTSLGGVYELERRLPSLGWKPRLRKTSDLADFADVGTPDLGDDFGILAIIGLVIVAVLTLLVLLPILLFVAEFALVLALIIPITIVALVLGLKQHTVLLRRQSDGIIVDTREVHGVIGTVRAARELKSAAQAGAYK